MGAFKATIPILVLALLAMVCSSASGSIYWTDVGKLGRVNLDGTYPSIFWGRFELSPLIHGCGVAVNGQHIYWADSSGNAIGRSDLDGTDAEFTFITGVDEPCGVAVDGTHIYWANRKGGTIGRARIDGSEVIQDFIESSGQPCGVAVDSSYVYWGNLKTDTVARTDINGEGAPETIVAKAFGACAVAVDQTHLFWGGYGGAIGRAQLDGSMPNAEFIPGINRPCGIAVDSNHIYWTEESDHTTQGRIGVANLDGTLVNPSLVTNEIYTPCGIAVDFETFVPAPPRPAAHFEFGKVRHNRTRGTASILVHFPSAGSVRVMPSRGLNLRFLPERSPDLDLLSGGRCWLKISANGKMRFGRRVLEQLRRHGRSSIAFGIEYLEEGKFPSWQVRKVNLLKDM